MTKTNSLVGLPTSHGISKMGNINLCTVTCTISDMPMFTINFRRPDTDVYNKTNAIKSKTHYDGSYGFDWLRDEYVYDVLEIKELGIDSDTGKHKKSRLYRGKIDHLLDEYLQLRPSQPTYVGSVIRNPRAEIVDCASLIFTITEALIVEVQARTIKTTLGKIYIPAWLAILPATHYSKINASGVDLYLEVEQEQATDKIINGFSDPLPNIEIFFEADSGITVTPNGITTLSDLITGVKPVDKVLISDNSTNKLQNKVVKRHKNLNKKVNIKCETPSNYVRFVKVIAKDSTKNCQRVVGLLCVYPNDDVKEANIRIVPTIIPKSTSVSRPLDEKALNTRIKKQFLNQANIFAKIVTEKPFDINGIDKDNICRKIFDIEMSTNGLKTENKQQIIKGNLDYAHYSITTIYANINNITLNESNDNYQTYIFFTNYVPHSNVVANSYGKLKNPDYKKRMWGNTAVIYKTGLGYLGTPAHELGHSFSLPHTFAESRHSDILRKKKYYLTHHTFWQGYTDNVMDYSFTDAGYDNPYMPIALFKWQWNILRDDRSIKSETVPYKQYVPK